MHVWYTIQQLLAVTTFTADHARTGSQVCSGGQQIMCVCVCTNNLPVFLGGV
jgi:hypothetical protein